MAKKPANIARRTSTAANKKATPKTRTGSTIKATKAPAKKAVATESSDDLEPVERRDVSGRRQTDRRTGQQPVADDRRASHRRKVQRRRQIDPTTCERDYSNEEIEFMHAIDQFKRDSGRSFPTCQDVLDVIGGLGYAKVGTEA